MNENEYRGCMPIPIDRPYSRASSPVGRIRKLLLTTCSLQDPGRHDRTETPNTMVRTRIPAESDTLLDLTIVGQRRSVHREEEVEEEESVSAEWKSWLKEKETLRSGRWGDIEPIEDRPSSSSSSRASS